MPVKKKKQISPFVIVLTMAVLTAALFVVLDFVKSKKGLPSVIFKSAGSENDSKITQTDRPEKKKPSPQKTRTPRNKIYRDREVPPPTPKEDSPEIDGKPRIAIIIDDVGFDLETLNEAVKIDQPVTFAILPHTPHAVESARIIKNSGHEIILHQPMEPLGYPSVNPGEGAVLTTMNSEEIRNTLRENILSIPYIVGVNNHMGSKATADESVMKVLMEGIKESGLFFVDSRTTPDTAAYGIAVEMGIQCGEKTLFIDNEQGVKYISSKLDELASEAEIRGKVIGIGHIYPETVEAMKLKFKDLEKKGFEIVFASELVERN